MSKKRTPKTLTKRQRKELFGRGPSGAPKRGTSSNQHIHCIACGAHLDAAEFESTPATAHWIRCEHGSTFPCCMSCEVEAMRRLEEHDRTGRPVQVANPWH